MGKATVHIITGGQRSGKSEYGEELALSIDPTPTYLATSKRWDEEHSARIDMHQSRRTSHWINVEEELYLSAVECTSTILFIDCITLWLTNIMGHYTYDVDKSYDFAVKEWDKLIKKDQEIIVISNEIGLGVIPMEPATRHFVDLQGKVNQYIAKRAEKLTLMVSGAPLNVK